jgi:AraC-like DNA-binding protein
MKFEIHTPCDQLKPYVKHIVISENEDMQSYKVFPGTSLVMGFQYTGRLAYLDGDHEQPLATAGITGLTDKFRIFKNTANTGTVLVILHETGASHFFANPVNELFGESLSLDNLFSRDQLNYTSDKLSIAKNDKEKLRIIEQLLIDHLNLRSEDMLVNKALQYIYQSKGTMRMSELAKKLNTSQSPLEKRFRRIVGSSPKKFSSIVRVKNVLSALDQHTEEFTPFMAGYYDQAHFIKEFKTFTSETPEQYLKNIIRPDTLK